ncbi:MAG: hypothetical protein ABIW50_07100 [Candidatus Limnocylindria bacterium]
MTERTLTVTCIPREAGWRCHVVIGEDAAATEHEVEVSAETLADLAPGAKPEDLVRESFVYLLEREPRESVMRSFELPIIARFFGDYLDEVSRRLRGE